MSEEIDHGNHGKHGKLLLEDETFAIRAAVFEVSKEMGAGFLESVYQECLTLEFRTRRIPFETTPTLKFYYKGVPLLRSYAPDFVCFGQIIVEIKAAREIAPEHRAQTLNYLKATGLRLGLLVNFGCAPKARIERFIL